MNGARPTPKVRTEFSPAMEAAIRDVLKLEEGGLQRLTACARVAKRVGFMSDEVYRAIEIRETEERGA